MIRSPPAGIGRVVAQSAAKRADIRDCATPWPFSAENRPVFPLARLVWPAILA
jgi:hypothetical protein